METDKKIETLRTVFRISNAAFEFARKVAEATGKYVVTSNVETMHRLVLEELEKENPNLKSIDEALEMIKQLQE